MLAEVATTSVRTLVRMFRREMKTTPAKYVEEVRLEAVSRASAGAWRAVTGIDCAPIWLSERGRLEEGICPTPWGDAKRVRTTVRDLKVTNEVADGRPGTVGQLIS